MFFRIFSARQIKYQKFGYRISYYKTDILKLSAYIFVNISIISCFEAKIYLIKMNKSIRQINIFPYLQSFLIENLCLS